MRNGSRKSISSASNSVGDRAAAEAVDGDEDGVAVAVPAEGRGGALDAGMAQRDRGIVVGRDSPLLDAEGLGRGDARPRDRLGLDGRRGAGSGLRTPMMSPSAGDHVAHGVRADVADGAVADAVGRRRRRARRRALAVAVVAEAQLGAAVGLDLDDEMRSSTHRCCRRSRRRDPALAAAARRSGCPARPGLHVVERLDQRRPRPAGRRGAGRRPG